MWKPGYNNGVPTEMEHEVGFMVGDYNENTFVPHFVRQAEKYFALGNITLYKNHNPKKALKYYNKGVLYLPNDIALLQLRGLCYYELGDSENAKKDWNRIETLDRINPGETLSLLNIDYDLAEMKGYSEMTNTLNKNKN